MQSESFNADYWYWKALEDFVAYKNMHDFVLSESAMSAYKSSMSYSSLSPEMRTTATEVRLQSRAEASLKGSLDHFAALTIIGMCTTLEVAIKDFYRNLFIRHPKCMRDYLGVENKKGLVPLFEIIESGELGKLIVSLSDKAASVASKGKYGEALSRALKLGGLKKEDDVLVRVNKVQVERNKIAHEKYVFSRNVIDVSNAHAAIAESIELLVKCAVNKDIPGQYTCVYPVELYEVEDVTVV